MTTRWLAVVGIGEDGITGLSARARGLVDDAEILVGGERHLAMIPPDDRLRLVWPRPLNQLLPRIAQYRGQPVCVVATGDPLYYGIGVTLARHFPPEEMEVIPSPSAFSLAAARLGWPLANVEKLTLHGRPDTLVVPFIQPGRRLLILSGGPNTPSQVASLLVARGYSDSLLTVMEHMGGTEERVLSGRAGDWQHREVAAFNTLAVECVAGSDAVILTRAPGLPDEAFVNDGNITRQEIRATALSRLSPIPGQLLWDVGAGCGSIAIEWCRTHPDCRAIAIERSPERARTIVNNAQALGTPGIDVIEAEAPGVLADLARPDAVFVGGGASRPGLLDACWQSLAPHGRLVAHAVTLESEQVLFAFTKRHGGQLQRISVSQAASIGSLTGWKPQMPVTQLAMTKS